MAGAGAPAAKFANFLGQADLWDSPDIGMAPVHTVVGQASSMAQFDAHTATRNPKPTNSSMNSKMNSLWRMKCDNQVHPKVHHTSVTRDIMRGRRTANRPRGRGNLT